MLVPHLRGQSSNYLPSPNDKWDFAVCWLYYIDYTVVFTTCVSFVKGRLVLIDTDSGLVSHCHWCSCCWGDGLDNHDWMMLLSMMAKSISSSSIWKIKTLKQYDIHKLCDNTYAQSAVWKIFCIQVNAFRSAAMYQSNTNNGQYSSSYLLTVPLQ